MDRFGATWSEYRASSGAQVLAVEYTVTNRTNEQLEVAKLPMPTLFAADGRVMAPDMNITRRLEVAYQSYANPPELLSPGVTIKLIAGFEVAKQSWRRDDWMADMGGDIWPALPPETTKVAG
jgi:hypothetical protein